MAPCADEYLISVVENVGTWVAKEVLVMIQSGIHNRKACTKGNDGFGPSDHGPVPRRERRLEVRRNYGNERRQMNR